MLAEGKIAAPDLALLHVTDDVDDAIQVVHRLEGLGSRRTEARRISDSEPSRRPAGAGHR